MHPSFVTTSQIAPVLLPALLSVLEGGARCRGEKSSSGSYLGIIGLESALACISILLNGLRGGSTRPFLRRVENVACCILGWDDSAAEAIGDRLREAAAVVLSLVPHCGKEVESAWKGAIESWCEDGISLLAAARPSRGGNGKISFAAPMTTTTGTGVCSFHHHLLQPPSELLAMDPSVRLIAACDPFHGICAVLSHMLRGSTFGRFVHIPTSCILNFIVQALSIVAPQRGGVNKFQPQAATRRIRSCALRVLVAIVSVPSAALVRHSHHLTECIATCIEAECVINCKPDPQALLALGILSRQLGPGFPNIAADGALPALFKALNQCRAWKQPSILSSEVQNPQKKTRKRPRGNSKITPRTTMLDGQLLKGEQESSSLTKPATSGSRTGISRTNGRKGKKVRVNEDSSILPEEQRSCGGLDGLGANSVEIGGVIAYSTTTSGAAGWDESDLSRFSAAGLHALANIVSSGGGFLLPCFRSQTEVLAGDALACLRNLSDGIVSCNRAAWVRGDQAAIAAMDLVISCLQAPLWDGTRSHLVGRANEVFWWLLSRGESTEMQTSAQNGLSACQALLNPRFAPLMKPIAEMSHSAPTIAAVVSQTDDRLTKSETVEVESERETTIYSESAVSKDKEDGTGDQILCDDIGSDIGFSEGEEGISTRVGSFEALKKDETKKVIEVQQGNDVDDQVSNFHNGADGGHVTMNEGWSAVEEVTPKYESGKTESREIGSNQYTNKEPSDNCIVSGVSHCSSGSINSLPSTLPSSSAPLKSSKCTIRSDNENSDDSLPEIDVEDLTDDDSTAADNG